MTRTLAMATPLVGAVGCATGGAGAPVPPMGVDLAFDAKHECQGVSAQIRLTGVPAGTSTLEVQMTDLDVPSFRHWTARDAQGKALARGDTIVSSGR